MAQEDIVERFKKSEPSMVQVNFTQSQPSTQTNFDSAYARTTPPTPNRGTYGRRGRGGRTNRGGRGSWNSNRPQCQICGKLGHIASYCYFRFDQQFQHAQQNSPNSSMHNALPPPPSFHNPKAMLATPATIADPFWYAYSGASHQCTPDPSNLQQAQEYYGQDQVYIGNGSGIKIQHIGNSYLHHKPTDKRYYLYDLLHVPSIAHNLVSVSKFARDNNVYFSFWPDVCFVKSQATKEVLL
ncbi:uncharacterized protein LOC110263850 [Arachis ipaensis]|uniref:uncharacterized protein LOC110263850 n=1 Tax=Arachis ipaensis TaxID=130454 RepID=UPI000A2B251C|nr:uncharacterized protein LOC110263850 [Arachis ipaensis]